MPIQPPKFRVSPMELEAAADVLQQIRQAREESEDLSDCLLRELSLSGEDLMGLGFRRVRSTSRARTSSS